jgi:hypothetical protein
MLTHGAPGVISAMHFKSIIFPTGRKESIVANSCMFSSISESEFSYTADVRRGENKINT